MNHSLFYSSGIWKVNQLVKVLNLWSNSQTGLANIFLISFSSVIHCDSDLGFLNSVINAFLIWFSGLGCECPWTSFMYQLSARSLRVVLNWVLLTASLVTFLIFHTASHRNQCWSGSSDPSPLKIGSLISFFIDERGSRRNWRNEDPFDTRFYTNKTETLQVESY